MTENNMNSISEKKQNRPMKLQTIILFTAIIFIIATLSIFVENFASLNNFINLFVQVAPIGIMACGVTFVMITGGIDISLPAVMATSAVIGADYMAKTGDLFFGTLLIILVGAFLGCINGAAVAYLKMVPLVVTLSMMTICTGIATAWTNGGSVGGLSSDFSSFFNGAAVITIFVSAAVILSIILRKTVYGRWLYYIGNNENTAKVSGIPTRHAILLAYVISGICAGFAGIFNTAALSSARASMGPESQILDIISSAVIGGVSVNGGSGSILGVFFGAILIIMINNVMNLIGISDYYTGLIKGLIIIFAMGVDALKTRFAKA